MVISYCYYIILTFEEKEAPPVIIKREGKQRGQGEEGRGKEGRGKEGRGKEGIGNKGWGKERRGKGGQGRLRWSRGENKTQVGGTTLWHKI